MITSASVVRILPGTKKSSKIKIIANIISPRLSWSNPRRPHHKLSQLILKSIHFNISSFDFIFFRSNEFLLSSF